MTQNNKFKNSYSDINECTSRGTCSISPTISGLEEVAILLLQHIAHYILNLGNLGAKNEEIRYKTIYSLASLISINEFSEKQLHSIIIAEYYILEEVKNFYVQLCKEKNIQANKIKSIKTINEKTSIASMIAFGEKILLEKFKKLTKEEKNLNAVLQIVLKSVSLNLIKLKDFNSFNQNAYQELLKTLDIFNHNKVTSAQLLVKINKLVELDNQMQLQISELLLKSFNGIEKTNVSHSTTSGKAILVSGNNFFDLYQILLDTIDKNIDIYTHSNLLITHALDKFKQFKHLKAHYGNSTESCILDFATFPGAILLTKNSQNNTEYLYRGRLFSNDYIVPNGVTKIETNNFQPVIEASLSAKGFSKGKTKPSSEIGYNLDEIKQVFEIITNKLNLGEIKHLYIIGLDPHTESQHAYFYDLFNEIKEDEFVISFSYESKKENIYTINVGNFVPLVTNILKHLFEKYPIESPKIVFYITTCDVMTISSIISLKNKGAKNLYLAQCPPTIINPTVQDTFNKYYSIEKSTTVQKDLEKIRNNKSDIQ